MKLSSALSVSLTTFLGGVVAYLQSALTGQGIPVGSAWKPFLVGAGIAGVASLAHLYQNPKKDVTP